MRASYRPLPAALALAAAVGLACKDSSAPNVVPQTVAAAAGDSQSGLTGRPLPSPLAVRVTGSDGRSFRGATVTWTVTTGAATLGSPTGLTDSLGLAATTVTLGGTPGPVGVQASVTGKQPVTFTATACDHPMIALGDTVPGALATTDCRVGGFYTDFYELAVLAEGGGGPQGLTLTMTGAFDTWLELYRQSGDFLGFDDDIDSTNTDSQLSAIVAPGDYLLAPSSYNSLTVGPYSVSAVTRPVALAGCALVWATRGITIGDSVTAGDCVDGTGPYYSDVVGLSLEAGSVLTVLHQSTAFDAALFLQTLAGSPVASSNDSATGTTNAYLVHPVAQTGLYLLFAATDTTSATGAYTLTISASSTLSGSPRHGGGGPQVVRMTPLRMPKGLPRRAWSR